MTGRQPGIVISETDIETAVAHLKNVPNSRSSQMPHSWVRTHVLELIRKAVQPSAEVNDVFPAAPGLWVIIKHFGADLRGVEDHNQQLQAWVLVRPTATDIRNVVQLTDA